MSGFFGDNSEDDDEQEEDDDLLAGGDDLFGAADGDTDGGGLFGDETESDEDELNYKLNEIETQVDTLKNRAETVRGENEQISDSIETVERNVDRLTDLYEIVTHGINPFVGDQEIGDAFETAAGQTGMFGDSDADMDDEITEIEAEDFLDDPMPLDEDDTDEIGAEFDDEDPIDTETDTPSVEEVDDGDELAEDDLTQFLPDDDELGSEDSIEETDHELSSDDSVEEAHDEFADDGADLLEEEGAESGDESEAVENTEAKNAELGHEANGQPYLEEHPSQYNAEIITLEWIDFLVETAGVDGAAQTIAYYRSVGWISDAVEMYLLRLLAGFGEIERTPEEEPEPQSVLETEDHKRSLRYISQIATPEKRAEISDE